MTFFQQSQILSFNKTSIKFQEIFCKLPIVKLSGCGSPCRSINLSAIIQLNGTVCLGLAIFMHLLTSMVAAGSVETARQTSATSYDTLLKGGAQNCSMLVSF